VLCQETTSKDRRRSAGGIKYALRKIFPGPNKTVFKDICDEPSEYTGTGISEAAEVSLRRVRSVESAWLIS
jgi:hypothetical protein